MQIKFSKKKSEFHTVLTQRINQYFVDNQISKNANGFMYFKSFFMIFGLLFFYYLLLFGPFHSNIPIMFLIWIGLGLFSAFTPVNIGHDAIHGSFSSKKWVNNLMKNSFNFLGASAHMWETMHNQAHHMHTNIDGFDEDLQTLSIIRLSPSQTHKPIHRYQHLYAFFFYGFASISWVFIKDYKKFFQKQIGSYKPQHTTSDLIQLFTYKISYYIMFIAVPLYVINQPVWLILIGFFVMHYFEGLFLAFTFMLAHLVELTAFPVPDKNGIIDNSWAEHQMMTTADFSTQSKIVSFFTGGLNFQVEHHLFPKICHVHYPAISKIVEKTANEFGVPYYKKNNLIDALKSHYNFLRKCGQNSF